MSFYLNKPNKRGWGVVYLRLRIGSLVLRLSTTIKVKAQYWHVDEGRIILPSHLYGIDLKLHDNADKMLKDIKNHLMDLIFSKILCNYATSDDATSYSYANSARDIYNDLKGHMSNLINNKKMKQTKRNVSLTLLLGREACKLSNLKTQKNVLGIISNFKTFLEASHIEDSIESANQGTMRKYLAWLQDERNNISIARGRNSINYIFKLLRGVENAIGCDFKLDRKIVEDYKEIRSMEERRKNSIALTEEELNKLASLELDGRLEVARDIFLLQCYCGFRFEDLSLLLDSKNLRVIDGVSYSVFTTQKKDITSQTPLNHNCYYPQAFEIYKRYCDKSPYSDKQHDLYNKAIRKVAGIARLDREIIVTSTAGMIKSKRAYKVHEVISSHDARHTFITNCIRYKGIEPNVLKNISGHADTKLIETVYCNLEDEDKIKEVHNVGRENIEPKTFAKNETELGISGEREAKSVLQYLEIKYDESLGFEDLIKLIKDRQFYIADNYGIPITLLKDVYNLNMPISKRVLCLRSLLSGLVAC